jgi:hypothetical protein
MQKSRLPKLKVLFLMKNKNHIGIPSTKITFHKITVTDLKSIANLGTEERYIFAKSK